MAVLTLERVLPELDAARKQLEEMRVSSDLRIRQLEAERDQSRSATDRALAAQAELNQRIRQLEAALEAQKTGRSAEEIPVLESRVPALEEELRAARSQAEREREEANTRIGQLESEREEMEASLAAKEKKLMASLAQIEEVHEQARRLEEEMTRLRTVESERDQLSTQLTAKAQELLSASQQAERIQKLEAALTELRARTATKTTDESDAGKETGPPAAGSQSAAFADLYQQTMSRLTVIQASAELLAMNTRLDASSRETAQEIQNASRNLSEIIKNFALPADRRKAE